MLALRRIFLHNWHPFSHAIIDIGETTHLVDQRGPSWSAVLDACSVLLTTDLPRIQARVSTSPSVATTACIALEFADTRNAAFLTLGACIERGVEGAGNEAFPRCMFLLFPAALAPDMLAPDGQALSRHELRQTLRSLRDAHTYDRVGEYQADMLDRLGGLSRRFLDLFGRAIAFRVPCDPYEFVAQWLLEARPLNVETLQRIAEPYAQLSTTAREVEEKLTALHTIVDQQRRIRHLHQPYAEHTVLVSLLRRAIIEQRLASLERRLSQRRKQVARARTEREHAQDALKESQSHLLEAVVAVRQTSLMRLRDDLQREMKQLTSEATMIHARWLALLHDLKREEAALRPLLDPREHERLTRHEAWADLVLNDEEQETVRTLLNSIAVLAPDRPPPRQFATLIDAAVPVLDTALFRTIEGQFRLRQQMQEARSRGREAEQRLEQLRRGARGYPREVERVCELLTHLLGGERPPLLCEVLEVPDERWQDAVEAMLGPRRFTILVQPRFVNLARQVIERARTNEHIYDVGLLDITGALHPRPAAPSTSLASQVQTEFPAIRPYLDTLLGDIVTCDTVDQLHRHRQAITPEVVVHSEWTIRAVPPDHYRPWFIGERAHRSQREALEQALRDSSDYLIAATHISNAINAQITRLKRVRDLSNLRHRLDTPLDDRPLRGRVNECIARQQSLDMREIEGMLGESERWREAVEQQQATVNQRTASIAAWETEIRLLERDIRASNADLALHAPQDAEVQERYADAVAAARTLLDRYRPALEAGGGTDDEPDNEPGDEGSVQNQLQNALQTEETARHRLEQQRTEELYRLNRETAAYNAQYRFVARAGDPDEPRYAEEAQRLRSEELPRYQDQIAQARRRSIEGLQREVLVPLRERIITVHQQLERFNDALSRLELSGKRYRFSCVPADDLLPYYSLMVESHRLERADGPVFEIFDHEFYTNHRDTFDQFYAALTRPPRSDDEQRQQEHLIDYRRFFRYGVEVIPTTPTPPLPGAGRG
ncbi:MAG: hypothetical protein HC884_06580 [Chloroflexaceae bacterium]|nr:hypothetical protein [Chloroflexaceae bacterium]